jgi:hypothetical protein
VRTNNLWLGFVIAIGLAYVQQVAANVALMSGTGISAGATNPTSLLIPPPLPWPTGTAINPNAPIIQIGTA